MSARDTADAILRDFRTSMADIAIYRFKTNAEASAVYDELDEPDWLMAELECDAITLYMADPDARKLGLPETTPSDTAGGDVHGDDRL